MFRRNPQCWLCCRLLYLRATKKEMNTAVKTKMISVLVLYPGIYQLCNNNYCPCRKLQVNLAKNGNGASSASDVLGKGQSHLCLTEKQGKWKCWQGKSTLGAACPTQKIMFCNLCCTMYMFKRNWIITTI